MDEFKLAQEHLEIKREAVYRWFFNKTKGETDPQKIAEARAEKRAKLAKCRLNTGLYTELRTAETRRHERAVKEPKQHYLIDSESRPCTDPEFDEESEFRRLEGLEMERHIGTMKRIEAEKAAFQTMQQERRDIEKQIKKENKK